MGRADALAKIGDLTDVSRETSDKLAGFVELLTKWNSKINLVSPSTIPEVWERHVLDSAQIMPILDSNVTSLVDIGTGGGFPGMILAVLASDANPDLQVTMIESDLRKCAFLQTAAARLGVSAQVISKRIEAVPQQNCDAMTSRALAPLTKLLEFSERHLRSGGQAHFMKGENADREIEEALASWQFDLQKRASLTHPDAVILTIGNLRRL
ncbi:MAG: 16S rRNA (guanine(527)-N(7))-methyltransferase RsmG [Pseudomonadota bacterium]